MALTRCCRSCRCRAAYPSPRWLSVAVQTQGCSRCKSWQVLIRACFGSWWTTKNNWRRPPASKMPSSDRATSRNRSNGQAGHEQAGQAERQRTRELLVGDVGAHQRQRHDQRRAVEIVQVVSGTQAAGNQEKAHQRLRDAKSDADDQRTAQARAELGFADAEEQAPRTHQDEVQNERPSDQGMQLQHALA